MPTLPFVDAARLTADISPIVENLLQASADSLVHERRADVRHPYPRLLEFLPVDRKSLEVIGESITAAGKELSSGGIGFYHHDVIPHRYLLMPIFQGADRGWLLTQLRWCRFLKPGWYESGGQFIRRINDVPVEMVGANRGGAQQTNS